MANQSYTSYQYRLRAGAPLHTAKGFVLQTFMAEIEETEIMPCTTEVVGSDQFRGHRLGAPLIGANYTRLAGNDGKLFQGKVVYEPVFVDEGDYDIF